MKTRIFTISLLISVFVSAVVTAAPSGDKSVKAGIKQDPAQGMELWKSSPVLQKLTAFYKSTTDFSADFKQVVKTKSPGRTFKRSGKVFFKRPGLMRWDYSVPDAVYYVSDGKILWAYDAVDRSVVKMKVSDSELYSSLGFLSGTSDLSDSFVPEVSASETKGISKVYLVPVTVEGNYKSLTLLVRDSTGEVVQTEILDPVGNRSKICFESHRYAPVPKSAFEFKVPKGVRVQDMTATESGSEKNKE